MHILGKVLLWLCVLLLVPAAIWLSTKTLDVRHRWLSEVKSRQEKVEQQAQQLADARRRVTELENARQRLVHAWGDVWSAPNSRIQPGGTGALELGVGASSNLPQKTNDGREPTVYVFAEAPGQSQFLGQFSIADIQPTRAIARLNRRPYSQETDNWPAQGVYHVRSTLPENWLMTTANLQAQQAISDARVVDQRVQLENLAQQIKSSQATLDQRLAELNGNPDASADAREDVQDGLVKTVQKAEAARDSMLAEVDQFRRKMITTYNTLITTLQGNVEKVRLIEKTFDNAAAAGSRSARSLAAPTLPLQTAGK
jgi:hypothetical protein